MTAKKIRHLFEYAAAQVIFTVFRLLPVDLASGLGGAIGQLAGPFFPSHKTAERNLRHALPELNSTQHNRILKGMWENLGRVVAEYPHLPYLAQKRTEFYLADKVENYLKSGAIVIGAHFGNWEIPGHAFANRLQSPLALTYRAPNNPYIAKMLEKMRNTGSATLIPKGQQGVRTLMQSAKQGIPIGILIDQKYNEGREILYFKHPAMTNPVFAMLAQRHGRVILPMRIERTRGANFSLTVENPIAMMDENGTPRVLDEIMTQASQRLESWVRKKPEQWIWLHKRWAIHEEKDVRY